MISLEPNEQPKTLTDSVYQRIRADIIDGSIAPESKLRIEQMKKDYDVGATPIREALSRLSSDGFVITHGNRGFQAAPISTKDLSDVTDLRILLENQALAKSIEHGDDEWESRVVATFYQLSKAENRKDDDNLDVWEERNRDFHNALISACTSEWLIRFYNILYDQHKRYRHLSLTSAQYLHENRDFHSEHQRIYDAAIARDVETACRESAEHIRKTAEVSLKILQENLESTAA